MKLTIDIKEEDTKTLMMLGAAGCKELLKHPELCKRKASQDPVIEKNERWDSNINKLFQYECTPAHALGWAGCLDILDYPEYHNLQSAYKATPLHILFKFTADEVLSENPEILKRFLSIPDLDKMEDSSGSTPLHILAKRGHLEVLDYPKVNEMMPSHYNCHGTPFHHLCRNATVGLGKLLKNPNLMKDYEHGGRPISDLSRNKPLRPDVKTLKRYGFKMSGQDFYPTKKLDGEVIASILETPQSIRFMIY